MAEDTSTSSIRTVKTPYTEAVDKINEKLDILEKPLDQSSTSLFTSEGLLDDEE